MDWHEVYEPQDADQLHRQAGRCMDCGIPFCHDGCPLGNLIPEWNDLTWRDDWKAASERLHATNNFPEFTGRLCPAPCETACVLGINSEAVTIKQVEVSIIDRAFDEGWVEPQVPERQTARRCRHRSGRRAGGAQQLTRAGHTSPSSNARTPSVACCAMASRVQDGETPPRQRLAQMAAEGTRFKAGLDVGVDVTAADLRARYDAVCSPLGHGRP